MLIKNDIKLSQCSFKNPAHLWRTAPKTYLRLSMFPNFEQNHPDFCWKFKHICAWIPTSNGTFSSLFYSQEVKRSITKIRNYDAKYVHTRDTDLFMGSIQLRIITTFPIHSLLYLRIYWVLCCVHTHQANSPNWV